MSRVCGGGLGRTDMVPLVLAQLSEVEEGASVCGFQGECLLQGGLRRLRVGVHLHPR